MFTKMDLKWGYNNIWIHAGNKWKVAFITIWGSYELTIMFFEMCNSSEMLQQMMNEIFVDMLLVFLIIYMNNLLITTKKISRVEHIQKVQQVLQQLHKHRLYVKATKYFFFQKEVEFLGMWISSWEIRIDEGKVWAVIHWKALTKVKEVRSFWGWLTSIDNLFLNLCC